MSEHLLKDDTEKDESEKEEILTQHNRPMVDIDCFFPNIRPSRNNDEVDKLKVLFQSETTMIPDEIDDWSSIRPYKNKDEVDKLKVTLQTETTMKPPFKKNIDEVDNPKEISQRETAMIHPSSNMDKQNQPEHEDMPSPSPNVDEHIEPEHNNVTSECERTTLSEKIDNLFLYQSEETECEGTTLSENIDNLFLYQSEETVLKVLNDCLDGNIKLHRDNSGRTLLHRAVENNFLTAAELFLEYGVDPLSYDSSGKIPLSIAIDKGYDEMAALLVSKLPNFVVRRLFGDSTSKAGPLEEGALKPPTPEKEKDNKSKNTYDMNNVDPMFKINDLITNDLDKTLLQVLDSFVEEQKDGRYTLHVKLLDTDDKGSEPGQKEFNCNNETTFQTLTNHKKKDAVNHPVVREYMDYKWKHWCRTRVLIYGCLYLFSLLCLTYSAVTGVTASDVHTYDTPLQYSRAVMEVISYVSALAYWSTEIRQIKRHKCQYFRQFFNWIELFSAVLIIVVLPLRYTHMTAHWYVFAFGYFLWAIRIFKYASAFRQTGVYVEVIKQILVQDFVQFSILFVVIITIFSGTFLLVLKADDSLSTHNDTSSFQGILFVGVRTLIEAEPIVDYTGSDGYRYY